MNDVTGMRFGRLVVSGRSGRSLNKAIRWLCHCDCGGSIETESGALRYGRTSSCGCLRREVGRARRLAETKHGHTRDRKPSGTWRSWMSMTDRCRNPRATGYARYGGRGIAVCERWLSFENFLADMGQRPDGTSIDRIDVNGHYEPGNCRWATRKEQGRNTRAVKLEPHEPAQIRWLVEAGHRRREVANLFQVSDRTVGDIVRGEKWA